MSPDQRYALLQTLLLRARALGTAGEARLDALLGEMDAAWDAMSVAQRQAADARAAALARVPALDDLHLTEVVRCVVDNPLPRRGR